MTQLLPWARSRLARCWPRLFLVVLITSTQTFAASVVYIGQRPEPSPAQDQIATVAAFYGLGLRSVMLQSSSDVSSALDVIRQPDTTAVVISSEVLGVLHREGVFAALRRRGASTPLLILGISEQTSPSVLREWSSGEITGCSRTGSLGADQSFKVAGSNDVTRQLGGGIFPLHTRETSYLTEGGAGALQYLITTRLDGRELPIFARSAIGKQEVFFATAAIPADDAPVTADPYRQQAVFGAIAVPMMFLRYAAGESAWHSPGDYANFTIDDLWFREPYGHVNYTNLLHEAEQHNFHATVAFIPWNFDRSQPEVVSLFREHPERLSVCVHGNNHLHQEFGPLDSHPLAVQAGDLRQALARMERFTQLTHVPYDPIMVFPHSISPEATFSALKQENYLATVNSLNVPSDAKTPADTEFALRTGSLQFAAFPSLRRYSAENEIPKLQLAIDAFLGNPMLFYAHESFFASGGDAFDPTADRVNTVQPDTQWRSLGDIVQHLYLERREDNGDYGIRSFSPSIHITNHHGRDGVYHVEKVEDFRLPLAVFVDGQPYPFERAGTQLQLSLNIASGGTRAVEVRYGGGAIPATVEIGRHSPYIAAVRLLSDLRDNVVSTTSLGRRFIRSYVAFGYRWKLAIGTVTLTIVALFSAWYVRRERTRCPPRSTSGIQMQPKRGQ